MAIEWLTNKDFKQVDIKIRHSVNASGSGGGSSVKSNVTCHKCGKGPYQEKLQVKVNWL